MVPGYEGFAYGTGAGSSHTAFERCLRTVMVHSFGEGQCMGHRKALLPALRGVPYIRV